MGYKQIVFDVDGTIPYILSGRKDKSQILGIVNKSLFIFLGTDPRLNFFCQQFAGHRLLNNRNRRQQVLAH